MLSLCASLLLAVTGSAHAHELSVEAGSFGATADDAFGLYSDGFAVGTWGLRGGYGLNRVFSVVGGWHTGRTGADVFAEYGDSYADDYDEDDDYDAYGDGYLFSTSLTTHRVALGAKAAWPVRSWVAPYATVQAIGWFATARLDDAPDRDDNPNELTYRAFAPGGLAALGVQLTPFRVVRDARLSVHLEAGYGHMARLRFEDADNRVAGSGQAGVPLGDLRFRGLTLNAGVGVAF
jgi:hypothetical protein